MSCTCNKKYKVFKKFMDTFERATIGKPAPNFVTQAYCPCGEIKEIKLDDYKGKYLILLFYPLDWTFVCPTEMIGYSELVATLKDLNCEIVGVSVDSVYCHKAWCETEKKYGGVGKLNFLLASDLTKKISINYGMFNCEAGISRRGYVIIDDKGIVRYMQINDDGIGRNTEETVRLVKALQFTDKHGVVCPLNWNEGDDVIPPTPTGIKDYLANH